jgi:hypothetical protein
VKIQTGVSISAPIDIPKQSAPHASRSVDEPSPFPSVASTDSTLTSVYHAQRLEGWLKRAECVPVTISPASFADNELPTLSADPPRQPFDFGKLTRYGAGACAVSAIGTLSLPLMVGVQWAGLPAGFLLAAVVLACCSKPTQNHEPYIGP